MKSGGGPEGRGQIDVLTLIFPAFVPAAVALAVQLIRIDSSSESNRTVCALCDGLVCQSIKNVLIFLVIC